MLLPIISFSKKKITFVLLVGDYCENDAYLNLMHFIIILKYARFPLHATLNFRKTLLNNVLPPFKIAHSMATFRHQQTEEVV